MENPKVLRPLFILGAGGFGREVAWLVSRINEVENIWDLRGFIDDDEAKQASLIDDYQVLGGLDYLYGFDEDIWCVVAVGNSKVRRTVVERLQDYTNIHFATLIDPSVLIGSKSTVGEGSVVCAGTIITVDVTIGENVIINLDCTIGHDAIISEYVTLYPSVNVSGNVVINQATEVGTNACIIQGVRIGKESIIGAGSTVIRDIADSVTAVGCPATVKKHLL